MQKCKKWKREKWMLSIVFSAVITGFCMLLTGCSETELEERCFPMLAAAGYEDGRVTFDAAFPKTGDAAKADASGGDTSSQGIQVSGGRAFTFENSKKKWENRLNKEADYNHLKIVVIEEELIQEREAYQKMMDYLAETEVFPRNTYVCAVEDMEDLFELEQKLPQDLGTYIEEFIKMHEEESGHILTLGDLLDEKENQSMILYMPYLEIEDGFVEWNGYVNILGEIWQDF